MQRQVRSCLCQGFLLVEAVLSAVIISVGLVWVTRGFSSQLRAIQTIDASTELKNIAAQILLEVEGDLRESRSPQRLQKGVLELSGHSYAWIFTLQPHPDDPAIKRVILSVNSQQDSSALAASSISSIRLQALWPSDWIPDEWD